MIDNNNIGGSLDDLLAEDGLLEETEELAIKEILADQIRVAMKEEGLTKSAMASRMKTSRQALDRLLDPNNAGVTLHTMQNAARALGRRLTLSLQ